MKSGVRNKQMKIINTITSKHGYPLRTGLIVDKFNSLFINLPKYINEEIENFLVKTYRKNTKSCEEMLAKLKTGDFQSITNYEAIANALTAKMLEELKQHLHFSEDQLKTEFTYEFNSFIIRAIRLTNFTNLSLASISNKASEGEEKTSTVGKFFSKFFGTSAPVQSTATTPTQSIQPNPNNRPQ